MTESGQSGPIEPVSLYMATPLVRPFSESYSCPRSIQTRLYLWGPDSTVWSVCKVMMSACSGFLRQHVK